MASHSSEQGLWREILSVARHAPSPHNVQPWRVRICSTRDAELLIDGQRTLPREDFTGCFLLSAMGMFLEAINLLAAPHGMHLEFELLDTPDSLARKARSEHVQEMIRFAHLCLVDGDPAPSAYAPELSLARRTCRISLHPTPVPPEAVNALKALAAESGHTYFQTNSPEQIERILARNIDAVFHDMNVAAYHDEITSWFRFTDKAAKHHRDGLDYRCMNLSRSEFWLSARMSPLLLFPPSRWFLRARYRSQLGTIPTIGMLSGKFFVAENSVDSGRFLLRFWLETAKLGLYLHPYGNLVTNPEAAKWLKQEVGLDGIWLVFKLGYADEPPKSHRRSLEEILIP